MKFFTTLAPLALLISCVLADITAINKAVDDVNAKLSTLNNDLQKTDGTNYFADLAIDGDSQKLVQSLNSATTVFNGEQTPSVDDATPVVGKLQTSADTSTALVDRLIAIKPGFQKALVIGLVQGDIGKIKTATSAFADAALAKTPTELKSQAQSILDTVNGNLARAAAAYA